MAPPHRDRTRRALMLSVAVLVASNVSANTLLPSWSYVPVNLVLATGLVLMARRGGASASDLGMRGDRFRRGLLAGFAGALVALQLIVLAAAIPWTRPFFEDDRAAGIGVAGLLYQVLVRIPLGTAVLEEIAFRGVVFGLASRLWNASIAAVGSSILFGLWHVLPALDVAHGNAGVDDVEAWLTVLGAVMATTAAGFALIWIRRRATSIIAPILVHGTVNAAAFAAAWHVIGP